MDAFGIVSIIAVGTVIYFMVQSILNKQRQERLMNKYGDAAVVDGIMKKQFWQGMTSDMLVDSLGDPEDIDTRVLRSKTSHTYKYQRTGKNRFATRINLDNGIVVGWNLK